VRCPDIPTIQATVNRWRIARWECVIRRATLVLAAIAALTAVPAVSHAKPSRCLNGTVFSSTSYGPPWTGIQGTGITATGVNLRGAKQRYGVAVDPSRVRLGSRLRIWPNPFHRRRSFVAFDTGGAIRGNRIDFFDVRGRRHQNNWGRRNVRVCRV